MFFTHLCSKFSNNIAIYRELENHSIETITYKELYLMVLYLERKVDVYHEKIIGIYYQDIYMSLLCIYLCLKLEVPFYVINIKYPLHKVRNIVRELGIKILLTDTNIDFVGVNIKKILGINLKDMIQEDLDKRSNIDTKVYYQAPFVKNKPIMYVETSGSTQKSKMFIYSYENIIYSALGTNYFLKLKKNHIWCLQLPLYHIAGLMILFRSFLKGASIAIPKSKNMIQNLLVNNKPQNYITSIVPTQMIYFLEHGKNYIPLLKNMYAILLGGSFTPRYIQEEIIKHNLPVYYSYGMSETTSTITLHKINTCNIVGKPLPFRKIKIDNDLICIQGKILPNQWEANKIKKTTDNSGWFHTNDLGYVKNGSLILEGRNDDVFISGGINIYPLEIENIILEYCKALFCFIIPYKDTKYIYRPIALIYYKTWNQNFIIDMEKLILLLKLKLPKYKIPRYFIQLPASWVNRNTQESFKIQKNLIITPQVQRKIELILGNN